MNVGCLVSWEYRKDIVMRNRLMITAVASALVLLFAGVGLAAERGADAIVAADAAVAAESSGSAGDLQVTKHVNADGEQVACIAEQDLAKILAWYHAELESAERRAQFEKELDSFEVDP